MDCFAALAMTAWDVCSALLVLRHEQGGPSRPYKLCGAYERTPASRALRIIVPAARGRGIGFDLAQGLCRAVQSGQQGQGFICRHAH